MEQLRSPILTAAQQHQQPQDHPPSPPVRHSVVPPEIKPRSTNKIGSPIKSPPLPPIPAVKPKNVSPVKFNPERVRSPTKLPDVSTQPPPPPAKSAAVTAALQRSLDEQQQQLAIAAASTSAPVPPEKPRKKSIDLIEGEERPTPSSPTSATFQCVAVAAKRGSVDSLGGGANGLSGSVNSATSSSPAASASSGPCSPVYTEDEKQENESTEKSELLQQYYNSMPRTRRSDNEGEYKMSFNFSQILGVQSPNPN
ncbi:unnamed protein product [Ceratitis capitata]|uniref:(Mediterranean fruit fly) hypothetical protein n=1 Tax=Ceratitis capitata TaxID=7213 RepID=A0A811V576_CERCA|nr:unnamed protein product [Ceratitis capitata]